MATAPPFDPDVWLAGKQREQPAFDPDAYLNRLRPAQPAPAHPEIVAPAGPPVQITNPPPERIPTDVQVSGMNAELMARRDALRRQGLVYRTGLTPTPVAQAPAPTLASTVPRPTPIPALQQPAPNPALEAIQGPPTGRIVSGLSFREMRPLATREFPERKEMVPSAAPDEPGGLAGVVQAAMSFAPFQQSIVSPVEEAPSPTAPLSGFARTVTGIGRQYTGPIIGGLLGGVPGVAIAASAQEATQLGKEIENKAAQEGKPIPTASEKAKEIVTDPYKIGRIVSTAAMTYLGGKLAGKVGQSAINEIAEGALKSVRTWSRLPYIQSILKANAKNIGINGLYTMGAMLAHTVLVLKDQGIDIGSDEGKRAMRDAALVGAGQTLIGQVAGYGGIKRAAYNQAKARFDALNAKAQLPFRSEQATTVPGGPPPEGGTPVAGLPAPEPQPPVVPSQPQATAPPEGVPNAQRIQETAPGDVNVPIPPGPQGAEILRPAASAAQGGAGVYPGGQGAGQVPAPGIGPAEVPAQGQVNLRPNGTAFPTRGAMNFVMAKQRKLGKTVEPVQVAGGWGWREVAQTQPKPVGVQPQPTTEVRGAKQPWSVMERRNGVAKKWGSGEASISEEKSKPSKKGLGGGTRFVVRIPGRGDYAALNFEGAKTWADAALAKMEANPPASIAEGPVPGAPVTGGAPALKPERTADTMSEAIALSSPSGRMSKRAADAASARLKKALFGESGISGPQLPEQPTEVQRLRRQASELRDLASRGLKRLAYNRKADLLDKQANELEAKGGGPVGQEVQAQGEVTPAAGAEAPQGEVPDTAIDDAHARWIQKQADYYKNEKLSDEDRSNLMRLPSKFALKNAVGYLRSAWPNVANSMSEKALREAIKNNATPVDKKGFSVNVDAGLYGGFGNEGGLKNIAYDLFSRESVDRWAASQTVTSPGAEAPPKVKIRRSFPPINPLAHFQNLNGRPFMRIIAAGGLTEEPYQELRFGVLDGMDKKLLGRIVPRDKKTGAFTGKVTLDDISSWLAETPEFSSSGKDYDPYLRPSRNDVIEWLNENLVTPLKTGKHAEKAETADLDRMVKRQGEEEIQQANDELKAARESGRPLSPTEYSQLKAAAEGKMYTEKETVNVQDIPDQETIEIEGEKFTVRSNPDTGKVELIDDVKIEVNPEQEIQVDKGTAKKIPEVPDFTSPNPMGGEIRYFAENKMPMPDPGDKIIPESIRVIQNPRKPYEAYRISVAEKPNGEKYVVIEKKRETGGSADRMNIRFEKQSGNEMDVLDRVAWIARETDRIWKDYGEPAGSDLFSEVQPTPAPPQDINAVFENTQVLPKAKKPVEAEAPGMFKPEAGQGIKAESVVTQEQKAKLGPSEAPADVPDMFAPKGAKGIESKPEGEEANARPTGQKRNPPPTAGGPEPSGSVREGGRGGRPGIRVADQNRIPQPRVHVDSKSYAAGLDQDQQLGVNLALTRFDSGGKGFMLADGTGVGKTRQILAIADQTAKKTGKLVLIVTQNKQIIEGSFTQDAKAMGISPKQFEIGTYDDLRNGKIGKKNYGLAIYDEAHNLKNTESRKALAFSKVKSDHQMFATATPMDRPIAAVYFLSEITGRPQDEILRQIGVEIVQTTLSDGTIVERPQLMGGFSWQNVLDNLVELRGQAVESGAMIRREYPFYGDIKTETVSMPDDTLQQQAEIDDYWQARLAGVRRNPMVRRNLAGQRIGELSRFTESRKFQDVASVADRELAEGRKVVIVAENINDSELKGLRESVPGLITQLVKHFEEKGVKVAKIFGLGSKAAAVDVFQSGKVDMAIATPKSGGAGINLDDPVGDSPRTMIIATANFSGDVFDQILGRVSRRNTKSPARITFIRSAESLSDQRRGEILKRKLDILRRIQTGEDIDVARGIEIPQQGGGGAGVTLHAGIPYEGIGERPVPRDAFDMFEGKAETEESRTLQSTIIPGAKEFIEQDVVPGMTKAGRTISETWDAVRRTLAPASRGLLAKAAALNLRERGSIKARNLDRIETAIAPGRKYFDKAGGKITDPQSRSYQFIKASEEGSIDSLPEQERPFAQMNYDIMDSLLEKVRARGRLESTKTTAEKMADPETESTIYYFPRLWKDPAKAEKVLFEILSKRPFEGRKAFLKQRKINLFEEGIQAGLEPAYDNPLDLVYHKAAEIEKWVMAKDFMESEKEAGRMEFVRVEKRPPEGWKKIDDPMGQVHYRNADKELVLSGNYYAPEQSATVFNNLVSKGLRGNSAFRAYLGAANVLNQFQLGYSAFHAGFTTIDVVVSNIAAGLRQATQGRILSAGRSIGLAPVSPILNVIRGGKMIREWNVPGSTTPEIARLVELSQAGGARAKMDSFYRTKITKRMLRAFRSGNLLGGLIRLPFAATEQTMRPILEWLVPRQKMGIIAMLAKDELARNPNMTHEEAQSQLAKIVDSVDNRMGQLIYDNLFWNKTAKDLGMASVRSLGWNLGTIREGVGGLADFGKQGWRALRFKKPEMTHRMSYVIGLPLVVGTLGAIYQYLATGKGPEELKDYYYPKTGGMDEHGRPERVVLPSYMKDLYHYYKAPFKTVSNKLHPLLNLTAEMLANRDYYGVEIRHKDDPLVQQALDELKHIGAAVEPFAVRGLRRNTELGESKAQAGLPFIGITPAPAGINASKAEEKARELMIENMPKGSRTREEFDQSRLASQLSRELKKGNPEARSMIAAAFDKGAISKNQRDKIINNKMLSPLQISVKGLTYEDALKVYDLATIEEKRAIRPMILMKRRSAVGNNPYGKNGEAIPPPPEELPPPKPGEKIYPTGIKPRFSRESP